MIRTEEVCIVLAAVLATSQALGEEGGGQSSRNALLAVRHNAHYIAPPGPGENWQQWLAHLRSYRQERWGQQRAAADSIYEREDLKWMTRNFVCGKIFI